MEKMMCDRTNVIGRPLLICKVCCKTENLLRCSGCQSVYYCSKECQREDWRNHRVECLPKKQGLVNSQVQSPMQQQPQPLPCFTNDSLELQKQQEQELEEVLETVLAQETLDTFLGAGCLDTFDNNNFDITSDGSSNLDIAIENLIQQQQEQQQQPLPFFNNQIVNVNDDENGILPDEVRDFSMLDELFFGSPMGDELTTVADIPLNTSEISGQNQFAVESETMRLDNNDMFSPELNMQFSDPIIEQYGVEEMCNNLLRDMNEYGVCVLDNFLGHDKGLQVLKEVNDMYAAGVFKDGQLVSNKARCNTNIRGDKIAWVDGTETGHEAIRHLINQVDAVVMLANKMQNNGKFGLYNIRERTKAMIACYPGNGSHYVKHVDNPNADGRCITAIYYTNLNWDCSKYGGLLRIFPEGCNDRVADIEPIFDRILFFWSDRRNPHEVQPAHRTRYAITLWYLDARERENALRKHHKEVASKLRM